MTKEQLESIKEMKVAVDELCKSAEDGASLEDLQHSLEEISAGIDELLSTLEDDEEE